MVRKAALYWMWLLPTPSRLTTLDVQPLPNPHSRIVPSWDYQWFLIIITFSSYSVAVLLWSANSGHTSVALETNVPLFSIFPDNLWSDNDVPFIIKATQKWNDSQSTAWTSMLPTIHGHLILLSLKIILTNQLKKICNWLPHLFWFHTS